MKKPTSVSCANDGCTKTWARDPVLEVECPKCHAAIGHPCVTRRPSGHVHSAGFTALPDWGHNERDILAATLGHYGVCPLKMCGKKYAPAEGEQLSLV